MLLNDLFIIELLERTAGNVEATLRIQTEHRIFKGHFPGRPVLPGACLVQLVQELVVSGIDLEARLEEAGPIKFIAMVEPGLDASLTIKVTSGMVEPGEWQVEARAVHAGAVCFRFKGVFRAGSYYAD